MAARAFLLLRCRRLPFVLYHGRRPSCESIAKLYRVPTCLVMNFATDLTTDEQWKLEIDASTGTVQGCLFNLLRGCLQQRLGVKGGCYAVIEVYQDWCGPCKAIVGTFRRLCFDLGDRPLKFFTVGRCYSLSMRCIGISIAYKLLIQHFDAAAGQ